MDTSTRRPFCITGLAVALILIGLVLYVSIDVINCRPDLAPIFRLGLETEVVATLFFLPAFILEDAVKVKKLTIPKSAHRRISGGLRRFSLILAILGALAPFLQGEIFLTSMVFVIHPATLLALVCIYTLITNRAPQT